MAAPSEEEMERAFEASQRPVEHWPKIQSGDRDMLLASATAILCARGAHTDRFSVQQAAEAAIALLGAIDAGA